MNFSFTLRPLAPVLGLSAIALSLSALPVQAQTAPNFGTARPLSDVLENMEGTPWSAVRSQAAQQAAVTLGPKHRNIPVALPFYAAFEGNFIPLANSTRLAIFSDDGCSVYVNGERIWNRMDRGQHLPELNQSLHALDYEFQAGQTYFVRIEYSNTWFHGNADADGATLFAYTYDDNQNRPFVEWRVGTPINTSGIRSIHWPGAGNLAPRNTETTVSAFLATDYDQRDATIEGQVHSGVYSDPCSYTWQASGGSFKNGINTGQSVKWITPSAPGTYTLTLVVDDQNKANQPVYENGIRSGQVNPASFDDDARTFTLQVTVM